MLRRRDDDELADAVLELRPHRERLECRPPGPPASHGRPRPEPDRLVTPHRLEDPRAKARSAEVPLFLPGANEDDEIERAETAAEDPAIRQADARRDVEKLLETLPPREARVLRLRYGIGGGEPMQLQEIARKLDLSPSGASLLARRAIARLRPRQRSKLDAGTAPG
ncbi:MAG: sigma-70 family RNA polymerase sigma factor [Holophagales bacterium]|nr:sigma-70 family RNA polymerase sigma factor [Holophagales bacterium]